jgi:hypothetical protein
MLSRLVSRPEATRMNALLTLAYVVPVILGAPIAVLWVRSWRRQVARDRLRGFVQAPSRPSWLLE